MKVVCFFRILLLEWTASHTASTVGWRYDVVRRRSAGDGDALMSDLLPVPAHARVVPVEQGRVYRIFGVSIPVPILFTNLSNQELFIDLSRATYWLITSVSTLFTECVLVVPDVVTVPRQEACLVMSATLLAGQSRLEKCSHFRGLVGSSEYERRRSHRIDSWRLAPLSLEASTANTEPP